MGVVYGAANIWQWRLHGDEPGHAPFFLAPSGGWREALDCEGSGYVGLVAKILDGLPTTDMVPDWERFLAPRGLTVPGRLHLVYQEQGGDLRLLEGAGVPWHYRVVDPRTGKVLTTGRRVDGEPITSPDRSPRLVIFHD
jgi:hypothetical protein